VATVSVIDTSKRRVITHIPLPLGSSLVRAIAMSPDGRFAAVTHLRSLYWLPTTTVNLGAMNENALTFLDVSRFRVLGTLLLDQSARGAANPWAVNWTPDGETVVVTHAGTHEVSIVDAPVNAESENFSSMTLSSYARFTGKALAPPRHPVRVRQRLSLPGEGPRALALAGSIVYVANYFSDNLCRFNLAEPNLSLESVNLGDGGEPSLIRQGEMLFNDGRLCVQGWQSCASCHDNDGRTDGLNWDLLNDGIGNPKNTKSLVLAQQTAPAMALGIRADAATAVRAGLHHILFTEQPESVPLAIEAYVNSLRVLPSPHLAQGRLSPAAARGQQLFMSQRTGCADCHPPPLFTDLALHDVGTARAMDGMWGISASDSPADKFDTPPLVELWRTGPYLHDGSAAEVQAVLTTKNDHDRHGRTSGLSQEEIDDLSAYLLSL
jgi:mono/diheme cytochrome c family protein